MGKFPFTIRPIKLDEAIVQTDPVSIPNDLSGKMTLSSKHASVHLSELAETILHKDISEILAARADEEVILSTNTILQLSRTGEANSPEEKKKFWPIPTLFGLLVGIGGTAFLSENLPFLLAFTVLLSAFCGILVGFVWQKFYDSRLKRAMKDWAKQFADE